MNIPSILQKIVASKKEELKQFEDFDGNCELSERDFYEALKKNGMSLIAEIKKASPSAGIIAEGDFDPKKIAETYESSDADCISVLTDEKFFKGSFEYLEAARSSCDLPLLCKDFIIDEKQICKARKCGADAVLLIAAILSTSQIQKFLKVAKSFDMDCLVEVHNEDELQQVLKTDALIIGINNRDLNNFEVDLGTTNRLIEMIPEDLLVISESGIFSKSDVESLNNQVDAILVGTSIMKSSDMKEKINELKLKN